MEAQDWSELFKEQAEFLREWVGLIRIPSGVSNIVPKFFRCTVDLSEIFQELEGSTRVLLGEGRIDRNSFRSRRDWAEFHWELAMDFDLVKIFSEEGEIGQNSFRSVLFHFNLCFFF